MRHIKFRFNNGNIYSAMFDANGYTQLNELRQAAEIKQQPSAWLNCNKKFIKKTHPGYYINAYYVHNGKTYASERIALAYVIDNERLFSQVSIESMHSAMAFQDDIYPYYLLDSIIIDSNIIARFNVAREMYNRVCNQYSIGNSHQLKILLAHHVTGSNLARDKSGIEGIEKRMLAFNQPGISLYTKMLEQAARMLEIGCTMQQICYVLNVPMQAN